MAYVQCIKTAVGENDALCAVFMLRQFAAQIFACDDFGFSAAHESGGGPAGLVTNGSEKFVARNSGRAALHDDQATGHVGDVRGFERRRAAGKRECVGGKDCVARASDVDSLVASVNWDLRLASGFEQRHAVASARNEKGAQPHFGERGSAAARQLGKVLADGDMMKGLELRFVGSGRCDARLGVSVKIVPRIERDGRRAFLFHDGLPNQSRRGDAKSVVGNGQSVRGTKLRLQLCSKFRVYCLWYWRMWLAVHAENLLPNRVRPAGEDAGFCGRRPGFHAEDARNVDAFASEIRNERVACGILTNGADGKNVGAKSRKIVGGIGAAPWNELRFAMAENQHRCFTRDARNFTILKFIRDKVTEKNNVFRRELLDIVRESEEIHGP